MYHCFGFLEPLGVLPPKGAETHPGQICTIMQNFTTIIIIMRASSVMILNQRHRNISPTEKLNIQQNAILAFVG